jgi:arylsulfatase A-like enzyme
VPDTLEGISPAAALDDGEWTGREFVFAEQQRDGNFTTSDFMTMIRSRDWKLVHFLGESYGQLFDLNNDPGEVTDLWNNSAHQAQKDQLLHTMLEWHIASQVKTANWTKAWR